MKVELKEIIDQLTELITLKKNYKVVALVEDERVVGWTIGEIIEDGAIVLPPEPVKYKTIKELASDYLENV